MGFVLKDKALNEWIPGGQRKDFKDRATTVQIGQVSFISAYHPLSSHGITALDKYCYDLEDLIAEILTKNLLIIGSDHNAHIGGKEKAPATCGMFGMKTSTNEAGRKLMAWREVQGLQWTNSFLAIKNRGSWFNNSTTKWYKLDGFMMRGNQRHMHLQKIRTWNYLSFSDHKPVTAFLLINQKRWRNHNKPTPNIQWEKLRDAKLASAYKFSTTEIIENHEVGKMGSWTELSSILLRVAKDICGVQSKKVQTHRPWAERIH